jgi:DNA-binding NtrC family response regulator
MTSADKRLALIAEETELGCWALAHALQAQGFEVYRALNWVEAAGWLSRAEFSLAVISLSLERAGSVDMAAYVRNHHPSTSLVLLADADEVPTLRVMSGPGTTVLAKPVELDDMIQAAREALAEDTDVAARRA